MFNDPMQDKIDEFTTQLRKAGAGHYRIRVVRDKTCIPYNKYGYINGNGNVMTYGGPNEALYFELYDYNSKNHERVYAGQYYDTATITDELIYKFYNNPKMVVTLLKIQKNYGFNIYPLSW